MGISDKIIVMHVVECAGGVERYLYDLLKYIDHDKIENILVCSQKYTICKFKALVNCVEQININHGMCCQDINTVFKIRELIHKYRPDIIYAHSSKAGALARIANIGMKVKCIYNPHGWAFNMQVSKSMQIIYANIEKILAVLCNRIVCISDSEKKAALQYKICTENKLCVIYNGIDLDEHKLGCNKSFDRGTVGIPRDAFVIGCVGRLTRQKAPDVFIKTAKLVLERIPNSHFLMVGCGEMEEEIRLYAMKNGFDRKLHITGWVNNPLDYIDLFDVAVLLSRWEGFGLVIPEYMLCRKPVVATAVDGINNIISDHVNGILVPKDDEKSAFKAIMEIYENHNLKENIISQGTKDVYKMYDIKRVVTEHTKLFGEIYNVTKII